MSFDKIFSMMYRLNENRFGPSKGKVVAGDSKLVAVPIDRDSLKVKLVGDMQDYIVSGRLTKPGFDGIINWLNQQPDIADYYYKLKDLKTYFIVYEILQDREDALIGKDKQVFKFTIAERKAVPALNPAVSHVTQEEVELIRSGGGSADLVVPVGTKALDGGTSGTSGVAGNTGSLTDAQIKAKGGNPITLAAAAIKGNTDPKVISFLTSAYKLIKTDPVAIAYPGLKKVGVEIKAQKLDASAQAFVYALNSGFGVKDSLGDETEDGITNKLISKVLTNPIPESRGYFLHPNGYSLIKEEASTIIGFDADAFVAGFNTALEAMKTKTGDIVVPPEGFKFQNPVTTKDPELAKFQTILKANLLTAWGGAIAKIPAVTTFVKATADGGYGTRTRDLVGYLKVVLEGPKYDDSDPLVIKPDFVRRMLVEFKLIKESNSYLGIGSRRLIREGVNPAAGAAAGVGGTVVTPKKVVPKVDKSGKPIEVAKKEGTGASGASGEYYVLNYVNQTFKNILGQAHVKKTGENTWNLVTDPKAIKAIVGSDANVEIKADKDSAWFWLAGYPKYRFGKSTGPSGWLISINGQATDFKELANAAENKTLIDKLNAAYGGTSTLVAGKTVKVMYDLQKWVANTINNYFKGSEFSAYTGNFYDNKNGAWNHFATNLWPPLEKKLKAQDADISLVQDSTQKRNLTLNQQRLREIRSGSGKGTTNSLTFKEKMLNDFGTTSDIYSIELKDPNTGSNYIINVDTDFG